MNLFALGETVKLSVQLEDGTINRYPTARIFMASVQVDTIDLNHVSNGLYERDWTPPSEGQYAVIYNVFMDTNRTVEDGSYGYGFEVWKAIDTMVDPITEGVLTAHLADYSASPGSLAQAIESLEARLTIARAAALDQIPDIEIDTALVRKLLKNRLELTDGASGNWVLYDDDNSTPILSWNVRDKDGEGVRLPKYAPARRRPV